MCPYQKDGKHFFWLIKQHSNLKDSQIAKLVNYKNSVTSIKIKLLEL